MIERKMLRLIQNSFLIPCLSLSIQKLLCHHSNFISLSNGCAKLIHHVNFWKSCGFCLFQ